ncbi:hypothetical protein NN561_001012 [Cricetulus griseus]
MALRKPREVWFGCLHLVFLPTSVPGLEDFSSPGKPRVLPHPAPAPAGRLRASRGVAVPGELPTPQWSSPPRTPTPGGPFPFSCPDAVRPLQRVAPRSPPAARDPEEVAVRAERRTPGGPAPEDARCRGAEAVPPCLDFPPFPLRRASSAHTHPFTTKKGSSMDMAPGPAARALPEVSRGQRLGRVTRSSGARRPGCPTAAGPALGQRRGPNPTPSRPPQQPPPPAPPAPGPAPKTFSATNQECVSQLHFRTHAHVTQIAQAPGLRGAGLGLASLGPRGGLWEVGEVFCLRWEKPTGDFSSC